MENLKQATSTVKMQAESLIEEMSIKLPILRSSNAESFCKILLPQLLKHHSSDIQTLELWQRGQQSLHKDHSQCLLSLDGETGDWREVASLVDQAFDQCTSELSCTDAADDCGRWPMSSDRGLDLDPCISLRDDASPLRLCVCKRCSRVVLQRRFLAHWTECQATDYSQPRPPAAAAAALAARDAKSPVNPGGSTAAGAGKVKPPKVKHGAGPPKFVGGGSRGNGALSERDRKRRKAEEGLEFVEEYRWVKGGRRGSAELGRRMSAAVHLLPTPPSPCRSLPLVKTFAPFRRPPVAVCRTAKCKKGRDRPEEGSARKQKRQGRGGIVAPREDARK